MLAAFEIVHSRSTSQHTVGRTSGHASRAMDAAERQAMLATVPSLRAFAVTLTGNKDQADDLVQEALLRAIAAFDTFIPGTNMAAWLMTILRNIFFTQCRKENTARRLVNLNAPQSSKSHAEQPSKIELQELRKALMKLPDEQREALMLVGAVGYSYDEAAAICGCVSGTLKSRVNRGRARLTKLMQLDSIDEFGPDREQMAVVA